MKRFVLNTLFSILIALAFSASPAMAQDGPPENVVEMWAVYVDMENQAAFEEAVKGYMALARELGEPHSWEVFNRHTGELDGGYYFRSCCSSWADLDRKAAWENDNPQLQEFWDTNAHPLVRSYEHHYSEVDFENSHWPEQEDEPAFVAVTTYQVKAGHWGAFQAAKADLSQIAINNGWAEAGHAWGWTSAVNGPSSVSLAIPESNFADMAGPDPTFFQFLTEQLGSEEAAQAKFQALSGAADHISFQIYTHRPELSSME